MAGVHDRGPSRRSRDPVRKQQPPEHMNLTDKTALITGASRGIGAAITRLLLARGCRVTGLSRTPPEAESGRHDHYRHVAIDLARLDDLPQQLKALRKQLDDIDILIANAGYGRFGSLEEFSASQIRRLVDVNLTSQMLLVREFLPGMKTRRRGHIVLMGSEAALSGSRKGTVYCATKFALRGFAQALRDETASRGIRVTLVNPGMVQTAFFDDLNFAPGEDADAHLLSEDVATAIVSALEARTGCCIEEINLSPQRKVIEFD